MAQCFGQSGCWKNVLSQLKEMNISVDFPDQFYQMIYKLENELVKEQSSIEQELHKRYMFFKESLEETRLSSQQIIEQKSIEINQSREPIHQAIQKTEGLIAEKTKTQEQNLTLQLAPLIDQLNQIDSEYLLLDNKINEIEYTFKQQLSLLSSIKKPAWYRFIARFKFYLSLKKQQHNLNKECQGFIKSYQMQQLHLAAQKKNLINEKYELQKQHTKQLEILLVLFRQELRFNLLKKQQFDAELEHTISVQNLTLEKLQQELNYLEQNKSLIIQEKTKALSYAIERLKEIKNSPDYKGAIGELEMIDFLKKLPNNHFVFSDVILNSYEYHYFNGQPLKSAQIDHVVVSPKGIFIIEVKNWSTQFTESNNYHHPYQQIERANRLCFFLLKDDFEKPKIRNILAYKNSLPIKEVNPYVKTLQISFVNQYITNNYFQDVFTQHQLSQLIDYFKRKTKSHEMQIKTKTGSFY
jgi:hypothetical protein